ncbi:MAG: sigma-70 family RNA polymerase sigma factor [Acidobacteria bacterium]|nr:sigma-70 family RNA polymerase sigma factor [Acidobacteriota bacterium]
MKELFEAHYTFAAKLVASITGDLGRAEELTVEAFLRWERSGGNHPEPRAWLCRAAIRLALDEMGRRQRAGRRASWLRDLWRPAPTPAELHELLDRRRRVTAVLARLKARDAELLLLRADGVSYEEIAVALRLNQASVGQMLARAQERFRKEYVKRYGTDE